MTLLAPKTREHVADLEPISQVVEATTGSLPNSKLTMVHWPELLQTFAGLGNFKAWLKPSPTMASR